jgi:hypothetical protein
MEYREVRGRVVEPAKEEHELYHRAGKGGQAHASTSRSASLR